MTSIGVDGYLAATKKILETAAAIKAGVREIPELHLMGDSLFVVAFASDTLDIYKVLDAMTRKKWSLNGLHKPACVHLCVTLRHTQSGVAERFIRTLKENLLWVRSFETIEGLRQALLAFARWYNANWLVARHGYQTPDQIRTSQRPAMEQAA